MDAALPRAATAEVPTTSASRYLQQLCKHFAHKLPVTHDEAAGHIAFSLGECRLQAEAVALRLTVTAPEEAALAQLQDVVARHLLRFAFREELQVTWRPA